MVDPEVEATPSVEAELVVAAEPEVDVTSQPPPRPEDSVSELEEDCVVASDPEVELTS